MRWIIWIFLIECCVYQKLSEKIPSMILKNWAHSKPPPPAEGRDPCQRNGQAGSGDKIFLPLPCTDDGSSKFWWADGWEIRWPISIFSEFWISEWKVEGSLRQAHWRCLLLEMFSAHPLRCETHRIPFSRQRSICAWDPWLSTPHHRPLTRSFRWSRISL